MMEYKKKKKKNLLNNTPSQPPKFRRNNWVGINDDSRGTHNTNSKLNLKLQC